MMITLHIMIALHYKLLRKSKLTSGQHYSLTSLLITAWNYHMTHTV